MPSDSCGADLAQRERRMSIRASSTVIARRCGRRRRVRRPHRRRLATRAAHASADGGTARRSRAPRRAICSGASAAAATRRRRMPTYALVAKDATGFSVSYDVTSPDGIEWSAKIGPEAQTEVVVSRILWGLGYHQPPVYYLPSWTLDVRASGEATEGKRSPLPPEARRAGTASGRLELGGQSVQRHAGVEGAARRPADVEQHRSEGRATTAFTRSPPPLPDAPAITPGRWFVVRDLGAALGETGKLYPRRNWLEGFEEQRLHHRDRPASRVEFDYDGRHQELLAMIGPADVQWAARQMSRLTDAQWRDAFRAGNYAAPAGRPLHPPDQGEDCRRPRTSRRPPRSPRRRATLMQRTTATARVHPATSRTFSKRTR